MVWSVPVLGKRDPSVATAKLKLKVFSYGKAEGLGTTDKSDTFTAGLDRALRKFQAARNAEVAQGLKPGPKIDPAKFGTLDWATKKQLGMLDAVPADTAPAPVGKRHPAWVFRGTGGVIGQDYVSRVCQQAADLVEEINVPWAATMGGIPVGNSGGISDPSMARGAREAFEQFKNHPVDGFLARRAKTPTLKAVIGGYSAGGVVAALCRQWVLANYPENYLCSFSFGDPTRPNGAAFYGAPAAHREGQGISSWHYGALDDWRHCYLTNVSDPNKPDMYARVPLGKTGEIMQGAFDVVTQVEFSDVIGMARNIVPVIPEIAADAGISIPGALGALAGGLPGLIGFGLPLLAGIGGLIPGGNPDKLTGTAAAAAAARIGLTFAMDNPPTKPHITYEFAEVWPGTTYLELAVQHVRDYASRVQPS